MDAQVPQQYKTLGIANLIGGAFNLVVGTFISTMALSMVGTICSTVCTLGLCPIGGLIGFFGFLVAPIGLVEILIGVLTLASPDAVKSVYKFLPYAQFAGIFFGDFVSPILGIVGVTLTRDPEVAAYIEGI